MNLQYGQWLHICVDIQNMFHEKTPWYAPWMARILPYVVSIARWHKDRTYFHALYSLVAC